MFARSIFSSYYRLLTGASLAFAVFALTGCNEKAAETVAPGRPVLVATVHYAAETPERSFVGTIAMILWARHSDATRERVAHVGGPLLLTAAALAASSYITDPAITMVVLTVAAIGIFCTFAVFWTLPTTWLSGTAAAGGIALINSIGNLAARRRA